MKTYAVQKLQNWKEYFHSKLTDADSENSETQGWLEYALACKYISQEIHDSILEKSKEVGKLINFMILNPLQMKQAKTIKYVIKLF
jgi:four helix bundle protein